MYLLAQTVEELPWLERYMDKYGLASMLVLLFGFLFWKYGPKLIDWVINFGNELSHNVASLSQNVQENTAVTRQTNETMSAMGKSVAQKMDPKGAPEFKDHLFSTHGTNRAILALSRAMREGCDHLPEDKRKRVIPHLDEIEKIFGVR